MLTYTISPADSGAQVIALQGRLTFGRETEQCRQQIKDLLAQGTRKFVVDLSRVEYADSAGIGFLVSCLTTLGPTGSRMRLAGPPERIRHVLDITKLNTVFEVYESRQRALQEF